MKIFLLIEIGVVVFIFSTTGYLPEIIASHFNSAGAPNGFMSQDDYLIFMLAFALGIPMIVVGGISQALRTAQSRINIPNKEFWLAPDRKTGTIAYLRAHITWLGSIIALFIAYVHWLMIKANNVQPAQLSNNLLFLGMGLLLLAIVFWGTLLTLRFLRVPK